MQWEYADSENSVLVKQDSDGTWIVHVESEAGIVPEDAEFAGIPDAQMRELALRVLVTATMGDGHPAPDECLLFSGGVQVGRYLVPGPTPTR